MASREEDLCGHIGTLSIFVHFKVLCSMFSLRSEQEGGLVWTRGRPQTERTCLGLKGETAGPEGKPHTHRKNMQTPCVRFT